MTIPITVVVSTKNESIGIEECLQALREFDEIVVVDSLSEDATRTIAEAAGVRVVDFQWNGRYPKKKQWILTYVETQHPWIFFIDGDESPTAALVQELEALTATGALDDKAACDVPLQYHFMGKRLKHGHRVVKRALVHRERAHFPEVSDIAAPGMGELEGHYQPIAYGEVIQLTSELRHDDPDPLGTWVSRHNKYADWEAYLRTHEGTRLEVHGLRSRQGRIFDRVPGKPVVFFIYSFLLRAGFLDGRQGFDYAFALSFYYWLIDAKTREGAKTLSQGRQQSEQAGRE